MNPSDRPRLDELFDLALQQPDAAARRAFLDKVCHGNPELRARLDALLAADAAASRFLPEIVPSEDVPTPSGVDGPASGADAPERAVLSAVPSQEIGRYKLLEKIGQGGFGEVWMAEQKEPVRRRVALKIIKLGMDTRQVVARFEAERQALQHAHQKGVIHRDIKPSNVMVAVHAGGEAGKSTQRSCWSAAREVEDEGSPSGSHPHGRAMSRLRGHPGTGGRGVDRLLPEMPTVGKELH